MLSPHYQKFILENLSSMPANPVTAFSLQLFQQIVRSLRKILAPNQMLEEAVLAEVVKIINWQLDLDRCVIMLVDLEQAEIAVRAESSREQLRNISSKRYQLHQNSEWSRLLIEGKPVPLIDINFQNMQFPQGMQLGTLPELDCFVEDTQSKSVIAFPLINQGSLLGLLSFHYCLESKTFSEDILELGEALAEEIALALARANYFQENITENEVFAHSRIPLLIVEQGTHRIAKANQAALDLKISNQDQLIGLPFLELFTKPDTQRLMDSLTLAHLDNKFISLSGLLAPSSDGKSLLIDVTLSAIGSSKNLLVTFLPQTPEGSRKAQNRIAEGDSSNTARFEELASSLSKQLSWERLVRQIASRLHSTLDRDTVLQSAADTLGRALKASACLIIRTDSPLSVLVTHEWVDSNISPLGLGRTSYLPTNVIACLKQKTVVIPDLSCTSTLATEDSNALMENNVNALVSTPITFHANCYGIIVVQNNQIREWKKEEVEMLECIAAETGLALSNAYSYGQIKEQLLNMNLVSNLTQQLTLALDQASQVTKIEKPAEVSLLESVTTPLSVRELEVLKLIAQGLANKEIAQRLFLTESTVELHASRIRKKLKLKSRTALVKFACDHHLV